MYVTKFSPGRGYIHTHFLKNIERNFVQTLKSFKLKMMVDDVCQDFYVALRLIAMAQAGQPATREVRHLHIIPFICAAFITWSF
jgi:hypothetical protein